MRSAAVDIGTNTARILVARTSGTGLPLEALRRLAVVTRLGQGVDAARTLSVESVRRTLSALADFASVARSLDAPIVDAVATSAVRDASDRDAFLDAAAEVLGVRPRVIDGAEEAALTFRGVASGVASDGPFLAMDLGGGSTEFVFGRDSPEYAVSIDIGSVRLTERRLGRLPAPFAAIAGAREEVDRLFAGVAVPSLPKTAVGVGGTFTSLAAIRPRPRGI
jgi:exopolyphosphatase/guanosine-5'-triphosphate,3'-diphosphate pyrophosphatase